MVDALERLGKLWKDGILTDEEFAEQKRRMLDAPAADDASGDVPAAPDGTASEALPDMPSAASGEPAEAEAPKVAKGRGKLVTILLGALGAIALAGGTAAIVFWLASRGEHVAPGHDAPAHGAVEEGQAPEPVAEPEEPVEDADHAEETDLAETPDNAQETVDAVIPPPLNLRLRCLFRGKAVSVSACLYGDLKAPRPTMSGTFKLTAHGRTILFGQERLLTAFRGLSVTYSLTPDFRAEIQSNSDDMTTLGVEVLQGDETVYSNAFTRRDGAVLDRESLSL